MKRRYKYDFGLPFGFPPFFFRSSGPWSGQPWGFGFPRREEYLRMLQEHKEELEEMQQDTADELKEVQREIEELPRS